MRTHPIPATLLAAALLVACTDAGEDTDGIALSGADDPAQLEEADDPAAADGSADDEPADDADGDGEGESSDADADAGGSGSGEVVDGTEAVPGTWQVGEAGTVTFDVVDGALVLEDVSEADGWTVTDIDEESDELEVDFRRDDVRIHFEVELESDGTVLEIHLDTDHDDAQPGTYPLTHAGELTFDVVDGALELTDLTLEDGWEITSQELESDEIELELRNGAMRWDVEIERNGSIEVELDYEVTGSL